MKKILQITTLAMLTLSFANAQVATTTPTSTPSTKGLSHVVEKGDKAITQRVNAINKSIANINKLKHLDDSMKTQLVAALNTSLTDMNNIKTKLDADTDLMTAKADYQSIFKDNRIEEIVIPQANGAGKVNNILESISTTTLSDLSAKIDEKVKAGKNVGDATSTLADAQSKFDDIKSKSASYLNLLSTLKVDHGDKTIISSNKDIISQAKDIRKTIESDLSAFKKDLVLIKKDIKNAK